MRVLVCDDAMKHANIRLRPIAMTLISTVLGALPLILSSGPGSEAREAVGWVVFGGLGLTAFFTLFLTLSLPPSRTLLQASGRCAAEARAGTRNRYRTMPARIPGDGQVQAF